MGRKKIQISRITDERNRQVTFNKRKFGVMKKAYELSVLCDCEIALIIFSSSNKLYQYASTDMDKVLLKYTEYNEPHESLTNKNIIEVLTKKENKNGAMSPESPEQEADYTLTPRTEAKYNKIDEDFQLMMQRNHRANMSGSNYTMPVSVPVVNNYNDSALLQASPQMAHANISPRPSSSETDSVYPSGSMLEMSNGYPPSTSPLGGSPSPGPTPVLSGHHNGKSSHVSHKQHSPSGGQSGRNANLRVVIPTPMQTNLPLTNDINYGEHQTNRQNQSVLNTPVVTLQTPIPGLVNYSLSTFVPQDFSMGSSDVMSLPSWNTHQGLSTVHHSRYNGLSQLTISNSTPPQSTSPIAVKVKSEPVSPPRDHHLVSSHQPHSGSLLGQAASSLSGAVIAVSSQSSPVSLGLLNHSHLVMSSRTSSTGQLTPTQGTATPISVPSPVGDLRHSSNSQLPEYESPNHPHKRPRISEGWST